MTEAASPEAIERARQMFKNENRQISSQNFTDSRNIGQMSVAAYLDRYGIPYRIKNNGQGLIYRLDHCLFDPSHTKNESSIIQMPDGKLLYQCFHNSCKSQTWREARQKISGNASLAPFIEGYQANQRGKSSSQKEIPTIELVTLGEILRMEIDFPPPVIDGFLDDKDTGLITGPTGIGKSLITDAVSFSVSAGKRLFDQFDIPTARNVLQIQSENTLKARKQRLAAYLDAYKGTHEYEDYRQALDRIVTTMVGMDCRLSGNLMDQVFLDQLKEMIEEAEAGLLILDPLISFHTQDENSNVDMRTVLDQLTELTSLTGVAVLVIHHHGKGDYQGADQARGATAIKDWARGILTLNKQPHESRLLIKVEHTKHGNFPKAKSFLLEVDGPRVVEVEPDVVCPPSRVKEVLEGLGGRASSKNEFTTALMEECQIARRTAQDAIKRTESFGFIYFNRNGSAIEVKLSHEKE